MSNKIRIACLGDIFPGGVLTGRDDSISDEVIEHLNQFDIRVATLECAIGDDYNYYWENMDELLRNKNTVYAPEVDIKKLKQLGVNVVTIANNHIGDLGKEGVKNTIRVLKENGIKYCGAGLNIEEAKEPAVVHVKGKSIAFLGYSMFFESAPHYATESDYGYNLIDENRIKKEIALAKQNYDYVFVFFHWGIEGSFFPAPDTIELSKLVIDFGADGIIGGHAHVPQSITMYKGKPVIYSLGNFVMADRYCAPPARTYYPTKEEIEGIDIPLVEIPNCEGIVMRAWSDRGLIGIIGEISITDNKMNTSYKLSEMKNNRVVFLDKLKNIQTTAILEIIKLQLMFFYSFTYKLRNAVLKITG